MDCPSPIRGLARGLPAIVLATCLACAPGVEEPAEAPPAGVLVIVCDTLRADHLGVYGYQRPTSPFLDELAERSLVFEHAYSHYSFTWPTVSNLFTGTPYSELKADSLFVSPEGFETPGLVEENETLAERLAASGVESAGVSANPYVSAKTGFGQGFGEFHDAYAWDEDFWKNLRKYRVEDVNEVVLRQLDAMLAKGRPWFHYAHYFDPHMPYRPPWEDARGLVGEGYDREGRFVKGYFRKPDGDYLKYLTPDLRDWVEPRDVSHMVGHYDAEIHHLDRGLRRLFGELEERGVLETSTVILTGDHGEAFFERDFWGHGFLSRDEEERVPMLVLTPDGEPRRIESPTTTTDVYHSLLAHFGVAGSEAPDPTWSMDLVRGQAKAPVAYTEGPDATRIFRDGRHALYRYVQKSGRPIPLPDRDMLFDTETDPEETVDLFESEPERAEEIRRRLLADFPERLTRRGETVPPEPTQEVDEETRERLRALGYVD